MAEIGYIQNKTFICIDESKELSGRVFHVALGQEKPFDGIHQLLLEMESVFDAVKLPVSSTSHRTFGKEFTPTKINLNLDDLEKEHKGKKATFVLHVQYRQNATWQGKLTWVEKNTTQNFKSELELIKLINLAVELLH